MVPGIRRNRLLVLLLLLFALMNGKNNVKSEEGGLTGHVLQGLLFSGLDSNGTLDYLSFVPPDFPLSNESSACLRDIIEIYKGLQNFEMWAVQLIDSSTKLQSGIFQGNLIDFGQYDECIDIEKKLFKGKYCLAHLIANVNSSKLLKVSPDLVSGPLTLTRGLCIPSTCSSEMMESLLNHQLGKINDYGYGFNLTLHIGSDDCHTNESVPLRLPDYIVIGVCLSLIALVIVSTVFDNLMERKGGNRMSSKSHVFLRAFSASRNFRRLLNTKTPEGSLTCINGIRFITIAWVAWGHRIKYICQYPMVNLVYLLETLTWWYSMITVNGTLSVDIFFLISGLLNAYGYMMVSGRKHNWKSTLFGYLHRYLRLTPAYALMIAITATWFYHIGNGPFWDRLVGMAAKDCQDEWLPAVSYVNNYVETNHYCMMQSWYLSADMQMYLLSPLLLYPLWRWPKAGLIEGGVLVVISIIIPGYVAYTEEIKTPVPLTRNVARYKRELDVLYLPTHTKSVSYVIGILVGYLLYLIKSNKIKWNLSYGQKLVGWVFAIVFMVGAVFGVHPIVQLDHVYNKWESSLYIAFYRFFWSLGIAWLFVACSTGFGGFLTSILNSKPLFILGRLTYAIYLTHAAVIMHNLGSHREPIHFSVIDQFQMFLGEFIFTIVCALILTITVESPILVIEKMIMRKRKTSVAPDNNVILAGRDGSRDQSQESVRNSRSGPERNI